MLDSDFPLLVEVIRDKAAKPLTADSVNRVTSRSVMADSRLAGKGVEALDVSRAKGEIRKELQAAADPWQKMKSSKHFYPLGSFPEWSWEYWLNYFYAEASMTVREATYKALHKGAGVLKSAAEVSDVDKKRLLENCLLDGFDAFPSHEKLTPEEMFATTLRSDAGARGFKVLFRGDSRKASEIESHGGTQPQSRITGLHMARGMDASWHPFANPAYSHNVYFRRGGHNKDNCLFTAISLATDFQTATKFPLLNELVSSNPAAVGTATVTIKSPEAPSGSAKAMNNMAVPRSSGTHTGVKALRQHHLEMAQRAGADKASQPFQSTGVVASGKVRDAINRHASEISLAGGSAGGTETVLKASQSNIYVVKSVGGWNTEQRQSSIGASEFPERATDGLTWHDHLAVFDVVRIHFDENDGNKGHLIVVRGWRWVHSRDFVQSRLVTGGNFSQLENYLIAIAERGKVDARGIGGIAYCPPGVKPSLRVNRVIKTSFA